MKLQYSITNASRIYCSISSFKTLSFLEKFSTLGSAATDESFDIRNSNEFTGTGNNSIKNWSASESNTNYDQNPNSVYEGNSMGTLRIPYGTYGQSYNNNINDQNKLLEHSSNRLYDDGRNLNSSCRMNSGIPREVIGGGNDKYPNYNGIFQENQGNYNMGEDGLHHQNQYNGIVSYTGNAYSNQQSTVANYQIPNGSNSGVVISPLPNFPQSNEEPGKAVVERELLGTIEELDAFCKERNPKEAVKVLGLLEQKNVSVDMPRYLLLMKACDESKALGEAKYVHNHLIRSVHHLDIHISNKILEMYSKCGSMKDAYKVFDKMPQRNLTSWDTMILWLAKNGHGEDAIEMFTEFAKIGLTPDNQMFHSVFTTCSYLGDIREGLLHFESMTKTYNIVPSMDDYASIVDMFASVGYLQEALEFIEKMPIKPSVKIWETMMKRSWVHGDLKLGDHCAEIVNILEPSRLDKHSKQGLLPMKPLDLPKEEEKEKDKYKSPQSDALKTGTGHRAGDTSHPDHQKIYNQLKCLKQSMKEAGYVPNYRSAPHDVDDESKEDHLFAHSERLALSQALLSSPPREQVRIIKNLRVCVDCHNFLKFASKLVGRKIIARDPRRFHHFEDGECSCGEYW